MFLRKLILELHNLQRQLLHGTGDVLEQRLERLLRHHLHERVQVRFAHHKGLGGIAIGLPLLEEMTVANLAAAQTPAVPVRAFNLFFGLGIPAPLQTEG